MRVITGSARGTKLVRLKGDNIRPTSQRVKEAFFSAVQFEIEGRKVLDLFAGSGQLGIEALSRSAAHATFVDSSREACEIVKLNLKKAKLTPRAKVVNSDSLEFLNNSRDYYDLVFVDPPFLSGLIQQALGLLPKRMSKGGIIICEADNKEILPSRAGDFCLHKKYTYGKTAVGIYRWEEE